MEGIWRRGTYGRAAGTRGAEAGGWARNRLGAGWTGAPAEAAGRVAIVCAWKLTLLFAAVGRGALSRRFVMGNNITSLTAAALLLCMLNSLSC